MPAEEITPVASEDWLLRRVLHRPDFLTWHDDFNRWVPSLAAVQFDPDGMSAFLRRLLEDRGDGAADVASLGDTNHKPAVVYEFDVETVCTLGYTVRHTPNDETPIGYAHTSVMKPQGLASEDHRAARTELATRMKLIEGSVELSPPDGA